MNSEQANAIHFDEPIREELSRIIAAAQRISVDVGSQVKQVLQLEQEQPLSEIELEALLVRVIEVLKSAAEERDDKQAIATLQGDVHHIVSRLIQRRTATTLPKPRVSKQYVTMLFEHNGAAVQQVSPRPMFHGKEIVMDAGFARTRDIRLWDQNERLDIHLNQFRQKYGKNPSSDDLLAIMLSKMPLPGVEGSDAFEITELARSIANNGVRKPPILDTDGTLLDGNRRVASCYLILSSDEFSVEQKRRAEYIYCWQLTAHANDDDRDRVVVSLNFESDCKQDWPQYVKARKVFEEWQSMLQLEYPPPGQKRQAEMKRQLSQRFALGPNTVEVSRYLRMVQWANEFEDCQIDTVKRDPHEVKHKVNQYFQYFDEFSKGVSPGKVAYELNQDEALKHLAFDLLYQGKFKNWTQIRSLNKFSKNEEAREMLRKARDYEVTTEDDLEHAQDLVEDAIALTKVKDAEERALGANTRIESFVSWLEQAPLSIFRDVVRRDNLVRLHRAMRLVGKIVEEVLGKDNAATA